MKIKTIVSDKWKLIWPDLKKLLKGACYAGAGAFVSVLLAYVQVLDVGAYQPLLAIPVSFLTHLVVKLTTRSEYEINA